MSNSLIVALQQLLRVALITAIPLVISGFQSGSVDEAAIGLAVTIAVLSAVDKFIHELDFSTPLDMAFLDRFKS